MARTLRTGSRHSLRSRLHAAPPNTGAPKTLAAPAQRTGEADAYTWAVNAALESGHTDAAYEIAAGYRA